MRNSVFEKEVVKTKACNMLLRMSDIIIIIGFLYSDFPGLRLAQTALQYTLLQFIIFIITDNYRAPPRYMTDTYNGALLYNP